MNHLSRRELLAGIAGALGAAGAADFAFVGPMPGTAEYMFGRGVTYLNTGSLGPTPRSILDATLAAWYELESNPVGMSYGEGAVLTATDMARSRIAALIGCAADELLLTRSTTNAMNTAALGIGLNPGDRVLTTDAEHEGGSVGWKYLKRRIGIEIDVVSIAPEDHNIQQIVERLSRAISRRTKVISVSHVITSTGLRMPIREIVALARKHDILSVIDGAQAVGGIEVNIKDLGCDAYAAPGHKWLMAPKGTGFLYISNEAAARIQPVEREDGVRFVVESTGIGALPLAVGLGAAADAAQKRGMAATERRIIEMRNYAYAGLLKIPGIRVVSAPPGPLATALVAFKLPDRVDSMAFRRNLKEKYNLVLKTTEKRWFNGMRISPHIFNTEADIDLALRAIRTEIG